MSLARYASDPAASRGRLHGEHGDATRGPRDAFQRDLYFGVLLSTAVATAMLIAPTANHRLLFRMRDKENLVWVSNRLAIGGILVLMFSLIGAILLVGDILFKSPAPALFAVGIGAVFVYFWIVMPTLRRIRLEEEQEED